MDISFDPSPPQPKLLPPATMKSAANIQSSKPTSIGSMLQKPTVLVKKGGSENSVKKTPIHVGLMFYPKKKGALGSSGIKTPTPVKSLVKAPVMLSVEIKPMEKKVAAAAAATTSKCQIPTRVNAAVS
jgi:hypothetical protein